MATTTFHNSCPALNRVETNHSMISIDHENNSNNNANRCDTCSECSHSSISNEEECSHCSNHDHSSITGSSRSSSTDHYHHHHYHSSNHSSWKEDLKSSSISSSLPTCSRSIVYHNHHSTEKKQYNNLKKNKKVNYIHDDSIPLETDMKSITSSTYNKNIKKKKCCFCCFRSNTTSRSIVFFIFLLCVLGAVASFFCWPRTPRVSMGGGAETLNGLPPDWWAGERTPIPSQDNTAIPARPSLRATWQINVTLDNRDNWIPTYIRSLDFVIMDSLTLAKFAWASTSTMVLQPNTISPISLTFNVNYQAPDNMDPTFQNLYNACGPLKKPNDQRPALNVLLKTYFHIFGIVWTPIVTATPYTGGILCPIK